MQAGTAGEYRVRLWVPGDWIYALGAAALSFLGVIHGEKLGWAQSWPVALGYLLLAALCALMAQREGAPSERFAAGTAAR